ncbi:MAG: endonuclease III, partial [Chlorobi bacterium]|nr:endonuclease III [Chlorobiota bacterium]
MTKREKAALIMEMLEAIYPDPPVPLYHVNAFTFLVAVLLSARTTDKMVNKITPRLFALADNPYDMDRLSEEQIREIIKPVGLSPQKAKAIKELSRILIEKYGGKVPDTLEELTALPGVGRKTANVVLAQWFGKPAFPVDTHIFRLMHRWGLSDAKTPAGVEKDAMEIFPRDKWNKLHLQMVHYGREYSPARQWDLSKDPITSAI